MSYDSEVLADTPRLYYKTDEASGTIVDSSGNALNLSLPGGSPTYAQTGPSGANDAMSWPDSSGGTEYYAQRASLTSAGTTPFTLECWFYLTANPTNPTPLVGLAFGFGNNSKRPIELYVDTDGKIKALSSTGSATNPTILASASAVSLNTWHHVTAMFSSSVVRKIRLDKVDVASDAPAISFTTGPTFFIRGGGTDSGGVVDLTNGSVVKIAKAALYQSVLSDARSDAHYNAMPLVTAAGSLSLSGSAGTTAPVTATGSLTLSGSAWSSSADTATGSLTLSGSAIAADGTVDYDSVVLADVPLWYSDGTETSGSLINISGSSIPDLDIIDGSPTYLQTGPDGNPDAQHWPDSSGATEYYAVDASTIPVSPPYSLECWIFYNGTPPANATSLIGLSYSYGSTSTHPVELYVDTDGKVKLFTGSGVGAGNVLAAANPLGYGWHHLVADVFNGSQEIFDNKVSVATATHSVSVTFNTAFLFVHGGGNDGAGDLRDSSAITIAKPAFYDHLLGSFNAGVHYDAMGLIQPIIATASLDLSATMDAHGIGESSGTASLTLSASAGAAPGNITATGSIELNGSAVAAVHTGSDTSNNQQGRVRRMTVQVDVDVPVVIPPFVSTPTRVEKSLPLPQPVLVKGRPT